MVWFKILLTFIFVMSLTSSIRNVHEIYGFSEEGFIGQGILAVIYIFLIGGIWVWL